VRRGEIRFIPLAVVAVVATAAVAVNAIVVVPDVELPPQLFSDFEFNVWDPGHAILDGESPLRDLDAGSPNVSVYPPAAQVATLPFVLLPYDLSLVVWLALLGAATVLALRLCGVTDPRVVALAVFSPPVLSGLAYANVALLVTLAVALAWVWRDRHRRVAIVVGVVVATRVFVWPLVVWLLITGRRRAAFESVVVALVVTVVGWAAVGFRRIGDYEEVFRDRARAFVDDGVSVASVAANFGLSAGAATLLAACVGLGALALAWSSRGDDLESLAWAVTAAVFASPTVWTHYYAVFLVPLALSTPRLSRWWLLPYLTIPQLSVAPQAGGRIVDAAAGLAFALATAVRCRPSLRASGEHETAAELQPAEI
jgi:hypothetical protein